MSQSRLIELSYYDPSAEVRLTAYADTLVLDGSKGERTMTAIRFGGYPEMVNAMAAAMHGGVSIEATVRDEGIRFQCIRKGYTKQLAHDGVYATATLMANDQAQEAINEESKDQLLAIIEQPEALYPTRGAQRRFPLSTYIKKRYRGRVNALLCDELHEYNNDSGQGDAMAELYGAARKFVGMTATLINGYSSGIFHAL